MTQAYEYAGFCIVLFWMVFRVVFPFVPQGVALGSAFAAVCAVMFLGSEFAFISVAVLAPFGALLPALAIQNIAGHVKVYAPKSSPTYELAAILVVYIAFLSASLGVFSFDPYRFGYSPVFGSALAFFMCGYAVLRGYHLIALSLLVGQVAWMSDIGSSNYFDHMTHVLLVPVLVVALIKRALIRNDIS